MKKNLILLVLLCFSIQSQFLQAQQKPYTNLQAAFGAGRNFVGDFGPRNINWINNGEKFSFIDGQNIKALVPKTQTEELIFDATSVKKPDGAKFAYDSYQWSKDSKYLLFQCNFRPVWRRSGISDYYLYSIADKSLKILAKDAQTAELSPNGAKIGYERGGNLFTFDLAAQKETQHTKDATDGFYNGRYGWAYEEEFGLAQAWAWSPDSKFVGFWQSDEREVPIFQMTDFQAKNEEYTKLPYPKVGDKNPKVKIGVIDINQNSLQMMNIPMNDVSSDHYIPRIYWTAETGKLAIVHLNRKQNHLKLFLADAKTGDAKQIMEEKSTAWIDVFDFFAGVMHYFYFPENVKEFFWISERDGFAHLYRYDYNGKLLNQVTKGNFEVVIVQNIDAKAKKIYYTSTEKSPTERQLYVVDFSGKNKKQLTTEAGRHNIDFSPNSLYYIDRYSNTTTPTQVELWETGKKMVKKMVDNAKVKEYIAKNAYSPREISSFTSAQGNKIDIYIIKPMNFDANKKYPLLVNIYGGPGAQSVYNEFGRDMWEQYLSQEGYVIVSVNNRGSGGYGYDFEKKVYEKLGFLESEDFAETALFMGKQSYVDATKIGIRGHSYGGYMASFTALNYPDIFKVAIVGAPVTDWRLYDSIYAERYMGLLPQNNDKYAKSSSTTYAKNMKGKMLLAHSLMDENVHVQNSYQLVKAATDAGKDIDLRIYPSGAHGVSYSPASRLLLFQTYTDFLNKNLK